MGIKPYQNPDGTFKKGVCPNPGGRPKRDKMLKMLREVFGDDGKELYYILIAAMYGVNINHVGIDKKINDLLPNNKKIDWRNLKKIDQKLASENAKWIIEQMFGKATAHNINETEIKTPEDTKIKVEFIKTNKKE